MASSGYRITILSCGVLMIVSAFCIAPAMSAEKVLHSFQGGSDGSYPASTLIADNTGNLYGTTANGGGGTGCQGSYGCGTVFRLAPDGTESVLHAFAGGTDGAFPLGGLIPDNAGNYYGTTSQGGTTGCNRGGCGTVFKLAPDGTESVLYAFQGGSDGWYPVGGLVADSGGNLYGTTQFGGDTSCPLGVGGCGTVFQIAPDGKETVLHAFQGGSDGIAPSGALLMDKAGNLYGMTIQGGDGQGGPYGVVFKIAPGGGETILHSFGGSPDGSWPYGSLLLDDAGNLYGTTGQGGEYDRGTVFRVAQNGTETVLYAFGDGSYGKRPEAGLVADKAGNLYGTTFYGRGCKQGACGTVFKLAPDGTETVLYAFKGHGQPRGANPAAPLLLKNGLLYGTTTTGGINNDGVVFSVRK
ncbi:MAG TPA: choice-of-anchor tandem repeat GloVer-containing protein [Rhizomicrobium sp.]